MLSKSVNNGVLVNSIDTSSTSNVSTFSRESSNTGGKVRAVGSGVGVVVTACVGLLVGSGAHKGSLLGAGVRMVGSLPVTDAVALLRSAFVLFPPSPNPKPNATAATSTNTVKSGNHFNHRRRRLPFFSETTTR